MCAMLSILKNKTNKKKGTQKEKKKENPTVFIHT